MKEFDPPTPKEAAKRQRLYDAKILKLAKAIVAYFDKNQSRSDEITGGELMDNLKCGVTDYAVAMTRHVYAIRGEPVRLKEISRLDA